MTQIKLRRDTSANFTSVNPVLGSGEPAYETDTKKLKIGDGTTAYTQLEYFPASGASMPSDRYINLTLGASGSTYTAPANGWYYLRKIAGSAGLYTSIYNNIYSDYRQSHSASDPLSIMFEVQKGATATITYNATGETSIFKFIYAEGAKND